MVEMAKTLNCVNQGEFFTITSLSAEGPLKKRLEALGFIPGEIVEVLVKSRIRGWPIVVCVSGTQVALREVEASLIWVS